MDELKYKVMHEEVNKSIRNKRVNTMASCKDCIHEEVCNYIDGDLNEEGAETCVCFKDHNKFVELPCKVGDTVYQTDGIRIYENKIERIIFGTNNFGFDETSIGKSIFLTREEARRKSKKG